jgi:hypothetical protein
MKKICIYIYCTCISFFFYLFNLFYFRYKKPIGWSIFFRIDRFFTYFFPSLSIFSFEDCIAQKTERMKDKERWKQEKITSIESLGSTNEKKIH